MYVCLCVCMCVCVSVCVSVCVCMCVYVWFTQVYTGLVYTGFLHRFKTNYWLTDVSRHNT